MKQRSMSMWMRTPNYGRAIASLAARYSARFYRLIVAIMVVVLLVLEALRAPPLPRSTTVIALILYLSYVIARLFLPARWKPRYYTPVIQFLRAQAGIASLTWLLASYAVSGPGEHTSLWILYLLSVMIISEHCTTSALLLTVGEIGLFLLALGYLSSEASGRSSFFAYLAFSAPFLTAVFRALTITLLVFLLHYLVRNVEARDLTINRYREMLDTLAVNIRPLHDPQMARRVMLNICRATRRAGCCSIWIPQLRNARLTLAACTKEYADGASADIDPASADIDPASADIDPASADIDPASADVAPDCLPDCLPDRLQLASASAASADSDPASATHLDCPAAAAPEGFFIALDDERLPARVARSGQPHFASRADSPPRRLVDALPAPRPFLPHARLELGVPIPNFQPHQPNSFAVLCLAFDRPLTHQEMEQEYNATWELARYLSPILYHASLLEQYQALQKLAQTVTHSLDCDCVLGTLLDLVTGAFGFNFATVSLVDEAEGVIRTVDGRNVPQEWMDMVVHPLDSGDIQADIVRTGKREVLTGWDDRFDRDIWERFEHRDMVRIFVPMIVADSLTGEERCIGTLEAGYRGGNLDRIPEEQANLLQPFVDQAAVAIVKARLYEQMQSKAEALTALYHGSQAIQSAVWQPQQPVEQGLLEQIGRSAEQVLGADLVFLFGYDEKNREAELLFAGGDVWGKGEPLPRLGQGNILDAIIQHRRPVYARDAQSDPRLVAYGGADGHTRRTFTQRQEVDSFAGVPLLSGDELLGIMCVNYRSPRPFSEDECCIIELFAHQAADALKSARQRQRDRELAIAQERSAFSRELHHSVSHDIFAVVLKARTALHHLDHDSEQAARQLHDIVDIAEGANRQLGYLISDSNAPDPDGQDFREVLYETAGRVRRYYDIRVQLRGTGDADLPSHVQFALSRIVREALNNVIRHAGCRNVSISYAMGRGEVTLEIVDDGVGFDPARALRRGNKFGLRNMQDYAHSLGCDLELESAHGEGTRVAVRVPVRPV